MGRITEGTMMPRLGCLMDARFLLVGCLLVLCDAAQLLDFPGPASCMDDQIEVTKPEGINWRSWRNISLVDSKGVNAACDVHPDRSLLTITKECLNYESGSMVAYVSLNKPKRKNVVYKIACSDNQADSAFDGPDSTFDGTIIHCGNEFMMVKIPRTMPGFSDEVSVPPSPRWTLNIGAQAYSLTQARSKGYTLTSDATYLMIKTALNASGVGEIKCSGNSFYYGDIQLIYKGTHQLTIDVTIICLKATFQCNTTHMNICIPPNIGGVKYAEVNGDPSFRNYGITINGNGTAIAIDNSKLKAMQNYSPPSLYFPWNLTLVLEVNSNLVAMRFAPKCVKTSTIPTGICKDGFMKIEIYSLQTIPPLDTSTVILGNGQCKPTTKTANYVLFYFPIDQCGTTKKFVDGKLTYEIEVHALWKDFPRFISRDSELRETIRCGYNALEDEQIGVNVATQTPLPVSDGYGPLTLVLNLYQDETYRAQYSHDQYPVVKNLRDQIFIEVQVLNRNDPDIELVLNDCWATMSEDSTANPQWDVVVDGCQENQDDYPTVFHPVSNVALPKLRKRFEVKAFAFLLGSELSPDFVFFHCSAIICNSKSPDFPLCTKSCLASRRKRDELFLHRHSILASLPGPVFFVDSDPVMNTQDENHVIKQITLGVLPAFGLVALIVLLAVLIPVFKRKLQC